MDTESVSREDATWEIADKAPDPECCVAKEQMILLLRKELQDLPPGIQKALSTYYHHDHSLEEAADSLGISVSAIKSRLSRGRGTLRSSLERKGLINSDR
jgi:RNA polymerase sigma-70 factor (ECF subfamily)